MSTAPRTKPAKVVGKEKTPAQSRTSTPAKTVIPSPFEICLRALRERYLGPPPGEDGRAGKFQSETLKCERSTKLAILYADPTQKLEAYEVGFSQLQEDLRGATLACHDDCFKFVEKNRSECKTPSAEFATSFTQDCLSTFLRVTPLNSGEEVREIASNGRVRWFVRHVCGDWSDVFPDSCGLHHGELPSFRLQQWSSWLWMVRAKLASQLRHRNRTTVPMNQPLSSNHESPAPAQPFPVPGQAHIDDNIVEPEEEEIAPFTVAPYTDPLSMEETEEFILKQQQTLIKELRDAVADAHRVALIETANTNLSDVTDGKTGITTAIPSHAIGDAANKKLTPKEMIIFDSPVNGWAIAQKGYSREALWNTNESIVKTLGTIKIVVGRKGNISADELRDLFPDSELYAAAGSEDWQEFIDSFRSHPDVKKSDKRWKMFTPKVVAARFLARACGQTFSTMKRKISQARPKKRQESPQVPLSNVG